MVIKKELYEITANKVLFDKLLELSIKPVKVSERIKVHCHHDDYNEKQTRSRKTVNTSD